MEISLTLQLKPSLELKIDPRLINKLNLLRMPYPQLLNKIKEEVEGNVVLSLDKKDSLIEWVKDKVYKGSRQELVERKDRQIESLSYDIKPTLEEHLLEQLSLEMVDDLSAKIGKELISNIDDDGYIRNYASLKEKVRKKYRISSLKIDKVLKVIQSFEPVGIATRDLKECLLMQIDEDNFQDNELKPRLQELLKYYLPYLERGDMKGIKQKMDINQSEFDALISYLKGLDPFPGRQFTKGRFKEVVLPSFEIKEEKGNYKVLNLEEDYGPRVRIKEKYLKMLDDPNLDKGTRDFIKNKIKEAKQLLEDINNRKIMVEKLLAVVIKSQKSFLKKGIFWLRPLQQEEVAKILNVHPSTISRAVRGKYVQTPHGIFAMHFLLPRSQKGYSSQQIKRMVKDVVVSNRSKSISDKDITDILNSEGVDIKRRTVAKYRKELNLGSSRERKKGLVIA